MFFERNRHSWSDVFIVAEEIASGSHPWGRGDNQSWITFGSESAGPISPPSSRKRRRAEMTCAAPGL